MSKVRINDLAREMEVKSRQVLDLLAELGLAGGKTHSSSLEEDEADKVRAHFKRAAATRPASQGSAAASRAAQAITPKVDLSHISKVGDAAKAVLAAKQKAEQEARLSHAPRAAVSAPSKLKAAPAAPARPEPPKAPAVAPPAAAPARPAPRKIVPQPRSAPPTIAVPKAPPAIASRPPAGPVVAKAPAGAAARPAVVVAPPPIAVVVKPPAARPREEKPCPSERPATAERVAAAAESAALAALPGLEAPAPAAEADLSIPTLAAESTAAPARRTPGHAAPSTHAQPSRRMIVPQTGPRPVYKAPPVDPNAPVVAAGGLQRGKPIFDRRPSGGASQRAPGSTAAPGQFPGGPRPKHPTRSTPAGYTGPGVPSAPGARPGLGARSGVGLPRPGGFGPRPGRRFAHRRSAPPAACLFPRTRRPPAVPQNQGRPDEGLCTAAPL